MIKVRCEVLDKTDSKSVKVHQYDNRKEFILKNLHYTVQEKIIEKEDISKDEFLFFCSYYIVSSLRKNTKLAIIQEKLEKIFWQENVSVLCDKIKELRFEVVFDMQPKKIIELKCVGMILANNYDRS